MRPGRLLISSSPGVGIWDYVVGVAESSENEVPVLIVGVWVRVRIGVGIRIGIGVRVGIRPSGCGVRIRIGIRIWIRVRVRVRLHSRGRRCCRWSRGGCRRCGGLKPRYKVHLGLDSSTFGREIGCEILSRQTYGEKRAQSTHLRHRIRDNNPRQAPSNSNRKFG